MEAKNIYLHLINGKLDGIIKCSVGLRTVVAYKIPRIKLEKCRGLEDLTRSGIYFLFGISDETGENIVYIGQAGVRKNGEGILCRLQEHKRDSEKDYWTEAVVFTTSNNSFGPTEISYLENKFCKLATEAKRYVVKNGNDPTPGHITEEKECELEEFAEISKMIMGTLGHKVFEPLVEIKATTEQNSVNNNEQILHMKRKIRKSGKTIEADCKQTVEGFVVLKGSHIELNDSDSIPPGIKEARQKANVDTNGVLQEDVLFKSPSYAAAFVIGGHTNGLTDWKTADGKTLKEIEEIGGLNS